MLAYYHVYQTAKGGMAVGPAYAVIAPYRGLAVHCSLWSEILYSSLFFTIGGKPRFGRWGSGAGLSFCRWGQSDEWSFDRGIKITFPVLRPTVDLLFPMLEVAS